MTEFGYCPSLKLKTSSHYHMKSKTEGKDLAPVTDFAIYNWDVARTWTKSWLFRTLLGTKQA